MSKGYLYLPMEIFVREFDSRLLIALMAVAKGMEVVMGQKWLMEKNIEAMPPGLWIFKTMTLRDSKRMKRCKAAGHLVASIDEEVPALAEGSGDLLWVSQDAAECCDTILCLGEEHAKSLRTKWPHIADKLVLTGNPRWDYLRPELRELYAAQAKEYRERHGRIILINTNSGNVNPAKKKPEDVYRDYVRDNKLNPSDDTQMAFWRDYWAFEEANLHGAVDVARKLAVAFPNHTVVLRPHPSERLSTYAEKLADIANVKVLFEGAAAPWILAADVLIHTDCTTGIEAYALEKPSICYETIPSILHQQLLSGRLSFIAKSADDVLREAHRIISADSDGVTYPPAMQETFQRFFSAQKGELAAERVVDAVLNVLKVHELPRDDTDRASWNPRWNYAAWWPTKPFRRKMFPPFDMFSLAKRIRQVTDTLHQSKMLAFVECGDSVVHLYPAHLKPPRAAGNPVTRILRRAFSPTH